MVVVVVVVMLVVAGLFFFTPGQYRVTANFAEAGLIRTGDSVRVAGIPVGTVKKVDLENDHVAVEMSVRNGVHIGADSSADVKMLTIVGGNYIDISPIGREPLGSNAIPVERTSIPYSLAETFQKATPKLSQIDAAPLRETLAQLEQGFSENPGAIKGNLQILRSMLTNLNKRQDDFGTMLKLAGDYSKAINTSGEVLTTLARNLSSVLTELTIFLPRFTLLLDHLASLLERLKSVAVVYQNDIDPLVQQVDEIGREFGPALQRYTPLITQGRTVIERLEQMVEPDGSISVDSGGIILSSDYCIPMAGVAC